VSPVGLWLLERYEKLRLREGHRTKTLTTAMRTLRAGLRPWLGLPAAEFGKADLRAARDAIVERGALMQANRLEMSSGRGALALSLSAMPKARFRTRHPRRPLLPL
jgi:hypothetical protein